ncbi:MAG: TonB-dependent receptor [Candidatus Aminicenantes bacterium]|nr:MAG: TonB-dependent receptor [Candidatus Aminicenantes bacterium]
MKELFSKIFVVLLAVAILPVLSWARVRGGDIYGTTALADGSKVPGVIITLTGNKIGQLTTISSGKGNFRFLVLPPGNYELKCELEGFKTVIRKDIEVSLGKSVTLDIMMETTTLKEEITISGRVGTMDTRRTQVGVNVDKEFVESMPTARNPWTLLSALPGIMVDRVDIGGADSGQSSNVIAVGTEVEDAAWHVDGANLSGPNSVGAAPAYLNVNSYDQLQVTLGANDITAQTGGIQLNFVTKRAGNRTSGDLHLYVEDEKWEMNQEPTEYMIERGLVVPGVERLYQYGINIGGSLVKNKLWWFGSWAVQDIHKRSEADLEDATWLVSGYGKLNFQLGKTSGDFHVSYDSKFKWGRPFLSAAQQDAGSLWDQSGPGYLFNGSLSHVFGDLMLEVKAAAVDSGFSLDPRGSEINPETGHNEGNDLKIIDGYSRAEGSAWLMDSNYNSIDLSLDGNYFLEDALAGDHEIRFGVDYFNADTTTQSLTPNQRILYIYRYNPFWNYMGIFPDNIVDMNFRRISAYIQDTITWGKLTASVGLRYDREQGAINPFTMPYFTWYEPGSPYHGQRMYADQISALEFKEFKAPIAWNMLSPRVSMTYDITGDGKNVVKLSAGRYMSQSGNYIVFHYLPYRFGWAFWMDINEDEIPQYEEMGPLFYDAPFRKIDPVTNMNRVDYDPGYNTPYLDELTLILEKALTDDLAVSLTGFYKKRHNLTADANSRGETSGAAKGIMADGSIETGENWEYIGTTTVGGTEVPTYQQVEIPVGTYYYNLDQAYDRYLGLQLVMTKKLSRGWMANLSFTLQDWKRFRFQEETLDMNNFDFFNQGTVAPATTGSGLRDVWVNSRWMVKFTGMYQLPWGLNLTAFFQAREGNPQPLRRRVRVNQGAVYLYRAGFKAGDERLPTFWMLNLGLEKTLKVTDTITATLVLDWYNATNNQIQLKHNLAIGAEDPGEPEPTMWSNAGLFQFGVRVNF